jgi:O-acetylserine/cysteine efflux transporter
MTTSASSRTFAPADLARMAAIALIWGVNNVLAKITVAALPPLLMVAMRFSIVFAVLVFLLRPLPRAQAPAMLGTLILLGPLHFGIQMTGLHLARELAPMVIAMQLWIPASVVFAGLILRERITPLRQVGVGLAFLGVVAMSFDPIVFQQLPALLLMILAALIYGLGAVRVRQIGAVFDPWAMQAWIALVTVPAMVLGSALFEHGQAAAVIAAPWFIWAFIVFGALVSSIVANGFMFRLVQTYEVSRITPFLLITPLVSFVMGAVVLGDHISGRVAIGGAISLVGVALVALAEQRASRRVTA